MGRDMRNFWGAGNKSASCLGYADICQNSSNGTLKIRANKCLKRNTPAPAIPLLSIGPKERKAGSVRDTCTPAFTAEFFTTAKRWEQPRSVDGVKGEPRCGVQARQGVAFALKGREALTLHDG